MRREPRGEPRGERRPLHKPLFKMINMTLLSEPFVRSGLPAEQRKCLQRRHLAVLHRTKLLAAARMQLNAALASGSVPVCGASPARVYKSPPVKTGGGGLSSLHTAPVLAASGSCTTWNWV